MKPLSFALTVAASSLALSTAFAELPGSKISGDYLEVRSCDVYTGPCFANSEMGLTGKEGMLVWSVREGSWNGVNLDGLKVLAVVEANDTLGDLNYQPRTGNAVLIVDSKADSAQKAALTDFARKMGGKLITHVVDVKSAPVEAAIGTCHDKGCASVKAGDLVEVTTSCLSHKHDICGNEETFYPPLSPVEGAFPVFAEVASYTGPGLGLTWQISGKRSGFLGTFSAESSPRVAAR